MKAEGGSADTLVRCAQDDVETRLRCSECQAPICPKCFVRTAVGLRCEGCASPSGPPQPRGGATPRRPAFLALAVVVALVVAGVAWATTRGGDEAPLDVDEGGELIAIPGMELGTGELPGGMTWRLEARKEGGVCTTLTVSPGPPPRERCLRTRSYRPVGNTTTQLLRGPGGTTYLTLGQASDRTERVRVAPDDAEPFEVPTFGGGTGLDVRFFVMYTTANAHMSLTALAADGTVLGRMERPKLPTRR